MSACRIAPLGLGQNTLTQQLPHVFQVAGTHEVVIEVLSGDCTEALRRTPATITVDVAPASATGHARRAAAASGAALEARVAARPASCKDGLLKPVSAATRARVATAVLCLVNAERSKRGRRQLQRSLRLQRAADAHSSDMLQRKYFEHEKAPAGPKLVARLRKAGYRGRAYAENIGYGSGYDATLMVAAWMHSPGHRANILHPRLRFAGVGLTTAIPFSPPRPGSMYTMNFGATLR